MFYKIYREQVVSAQCLSGHIKGDIFLIRQRGYLLQVKIPTRSKGRCMCVNFIKILLWITDGHFKCACLLDKHICEHKFHENDVIPLFSGFRIPNLHNFIHSSHLFVCSLFFCLLNFASACWHPYSLRLRMVEPCPSLTPALWPFLTPTWSQTRILWAGWESKWQERRGSQ